MLSQSRNLNCSQVNALLEAYLEAGLPPEQTAAVRAHLKSCPVCRGAVGRDAALIRQLQREADWRQRRLSPKAAARTRKNVYRRMRRALMMQRVTSSTGRVVAFAAAAVLAASLVVLWQRGLLEKKEVGGREVGMGDRGEVTTITFACQDYERGQYETLARDFEAANPDIHVQFVSADEASRRQVEGNVAISDGKELERLTAAADTFVWYAVLRPSEWTFLLDLRSFIDDPSFPADDFYPGTLEPYRWKGGVYGLPARVLPTLIFFDKKMFHEAGAPYPHVGWTWDEFMEAATQLTRRTGSAVAQYGFADLAPENTVLAMAHQYGIALWDDRTDPPEPLFDTQEVADLVRRYTNMALTYEIMPGRGVDGHTLVSEGKAAMWTDAAHNRLYHSHRTELGVVPFPEAVDAANPNVSYGFFISAGTAHPEAAWRWLSYLSANYQPQLEGSLPGRRSVTERLPWWGGVDEETRAVYEYAIEHALAANTLMNWPLAWAARDVLEDGVSVEEALASAQQRALGMQAELAAAKPGTPRAVGTPQPTPQAEQTVITFAPTSGSEASLYRELATSFQENHPDVWVEIVPQPPSFIELSTASDCFAASASILPSLRQEVRSLQPLLDADVHFDLSDLYPQFLGPFQQDGELWGLPYEASALMVYANLDRFSAAGLGPPEPGWSIQDFLSAAVALSKGDHYGFTTREGAYGDLIFVLERLGAQLFDNSHDPPTPTFDDPTVVTALGQYADLSRGEALSLRTPSVQSGWPDTVMLGMHPGGVQTGEVAMWIDRSDNHAFAGPLPFEVGTAPLPTRSGVEGSTEFDVNAYYISTHTSEPQTCWEWLTFLSGQPEVINAGKLPLRRSVAASPAWREGVGEVALSAYQVTLEYADTSIFDLRWEIPWFGYAYPWLDAAFQAAVAGGGAQQVLAEAQIKAESLVACQEATAGFADRDRLLVCARQVDPSYPLADGNR